MATIVQRFNEGAYIITVDGEEIPVYEGMELEEGDQLIGDIVTIEVDNVTDPGSDPTTIAGSDIEAIQQAILAGVDPTQVTDATAAGGATQAGDITGDGGGNTFVALDNTLSEVNPNAGYETSTFTSSVETPEQDGGVLLLFEESELFPPVQEPLQSPEEPETPEPPEEPEEPTVLTVIESKSETRTEVDVQTVTYDNETEIETTTTTITETYEREVTTYTFPSGKVVTSSTDWILINTDTDVDSEVDYIPDSKEEVLIDVNTDLEPIEDTNNGNNGHGNNTDGQDDDNPGRGSGGPNAGPKDGDDEDEGQIGNQGDDTPGIGNNEEIGNGNGQAAGTNSPDDGTESDTHSEDDRPRSDGDGSDADEGGLGTDDSEDNSDRGTSETEEDGGTSTPSGDDESESESDGTGENGPGDKQHANNGFGNGDQEAPGNSLEHNNAENASETLVTIDILDEEETLDDLFLKSKDKDKEDNPNKDKNNGFGNGDQDAPGNSLDNNNAENSLDGLLTSPEQHYDT